MYVIADGLARLAAPILPFTTEEVWRHLPGPRTTSVHLAEFPTPDELAPLEAPSVLEQWAVLIRVRDQVLAAIEPLRKDKKVGSSLEASVSLSAPPDVFAVLEHHRADLPMLFIVSAAAVEPGDGALTVAVTPAEGVKCERCWRIVPDVSNDPAHAGLCSRCQDALAQPVGP
jgi:isoleucyl-tRNA synthetase